MAGIKRTPADVWFSKCVREADGWTCQRCFKKYETNAKGLECSHFFTRGNWAIRFDPDNAEALCTGCHFLEGGPGRIDEILDSDQKEALLERKNDAALGRAYRRTKGKGKIARWYKDQYEDMLKKRADGFVGRIDFEAFPVDK